jgi:2-dehydropantoate 2-reductase
MQIKTVAIVGLGALGTLFGHHLSKHMGRDSLRIIADRERIERYRRDGVYANGELCDFHYVPPEEVSSPADLVLVAVKSLQLTEAIAAVRNQIGPDTLILSLLNGITSEEIIRKVYGRDKVIDCVAQGMDAVKVGNRLTYKNMGKLCFGPANGGPIPDKVRRISDFFESVQLPYEVDPNMQKRMWGKFMLNVGVNQTLALLGTTYGDIQRAGEKRDTMIAAMREVIVLSQAEGVGLTEDDLTYWLKLLGTLDPNGKPSMRQDVEAGRLTEVELFSGAVLEIAERYGVEAPVNRGLYEGIRRVEEEY